MARLKKFLPDYTSGHNGVISLFAGQIELWPMGHGFGLLMYESAHLSEHYNEVDYFTIY